MEDDPSIRFGLEEVLKGEGFLTGCAEDGENAEAKIGDFLPDLIMLDVMLPGKNGYEICKSLRSNGCRIPILMLTAKGQEIDKVIGLDAGADDYVTKPFGVQELLARVHALLRRTHLLNGRDGVEKQVSDNETFEVGDATISPQSYEATLNGETVRLTPKEMELLKFFREKKGKALSRDDLLNRVWGIQYYGTTRTLDQCVAQLRKKIGDNGSDPKFIVTIHGIGYKLA